MVHPCPICRSSHVAALDAPVEVPILMNRVYSSFEEARAAPRAPLHLFGCADCGFVFNRAFRPELVSYDGDYENEQSHSAAFAAHVRARAQDVIACAPDGERIDVLEVGCGQGRFLAEIERIAGDRLGTLQGFDPAWRGEERTGPGRARIHKACFGVTTADRLERPPNVVVFRHTIEHVPEPVAFLSAIRTALGPWSKARLLIETPCVDWIVERQAFQDFVYEHCSLFTARALAIALTRAGFREPRVGHVFGGQHLWASAATEGAADRPETGRSSCLASLAGARERFARRWRERVRASAQEGPVAVWGAGAKGVTFALMADAENRLIDHVVDINPAKQNRHIAGTGLRVLAPHDAARLEPRTIFVMNPNYLDEIAGMARAVGIDAALVPID